MTVVANETPVETPHRVRGSMDDLERAAKIFMDHRPMLFGIAYRMLSSIADAEDIIQNVWLRWQSCDRSAVRDPAAFLVTATTRVCINELQSARVRHETYLGPWLPEPVDTSADPALGAERGEALQFATLLLLERLSPAERAAYILREAFDYPYKSIAQITQVTEPYARQLVVRARRHLRTEPRRSPSHADHQRMMAAFATAARTGDLTALVKLLVVEVGTEAKAAQSQLV